jgi:hypothetical protein
MYILTILERAPSSGSVGVFAKCFTKLSDVSGFLQGDWYESLIDTWDEKDMRYNYKDWEDEDISCPPPTKEDFSASVLESKLVKKRQVTIHDAYSMFAANVPTEVILTLDK